MLVRSPLLTSHKWRELVSSGSLVCRYHDDFLWCYVCFVLFCFCFYAFEAAALRLIVLRCAGAPIAGRVSFFLFPFVYWRCRFFRVALFVLLPFSLCIESTSYVLSFRMVFFYLVTTALIVGISLLCENSTNQSINLSCVLFLFLSSILLLKDSRQLLLFVGCFLHSVYYWLPTRKTNLHGGQSRSWSAEQGKQ